MGIVWEVFNSFWFQAIIKLILGFALAGIIGLERSSWSKPAGFRTHALVGISSVLIMLCGEYMSKEYDIDPSRIPAQLLSGIGFQVEIKQMKKTSKEEDEDNEIIHIVGHYNKKDFKKNELLRNITSLENVEEVIEE